jgi:hypothetical protein
VPVGREETPELPVGPVGPMEPLGEVVLVV